jgi:hypothetical protein
LTVCRHNEGEDAEIVNGTVNALDYDMTTRTFPIHPLENSLMSTIPDPNLDRIGKSQSMAPREQLLGMLVVLLMLVLAIVLQSL